MGYTIGMTSSKAQFNQINVQIRPSLLLQFLRVLFEVISGEPFSFGDCKNGVFQKAKRPTLAKNTAKNL